MALNLVTVDVADLVSLLGIQQRSKILLVITDIIMILKMKFLAGGHGDSFNH